MKTFTLSDYLGFLGAKNLVFSDCVESSFKLDFSKNSLKEEGISTQSSSGRGIGGLILLFILFLCSNFLSAQIITVDGLTSDWSNNPTVKHVQDAFGNGVVDNQFTEGSKDFLFANELAWVIGQTKAKNDIANGGFGLANQVKYVDVNNVTQTLNGNYLVFAGDRTSNNGDAQIGFWFYLNSTAPVEVNGDRYFAPPHARGDLLVLADFTGGGRLGTVKVYRWIGGGATSPGSTVVPNTNGNLETTNVASIVAENNSGTPNVPNGWNFPSAQYDTNEFYEGFVDLSTIGGNTNFTCSATVLLETRSSQSVTASLDDFIGGTLGEVPIVTVNSATVCVGSSATLTATPSPAGTYTYAWTGPGGFTSSSNEITINVVGNYSVIITNSSGCSSSPASGNVTNYPVTPDNTASGQVCVGSKFTYEGMEYLPGVYNIARTDGNGCSWKTVLTVTNYPVTPDNTASGQVCVGSKFTYEGMEYLPGVYNIARTDSNGCSWKTVLTVTENPLPVITCPDPASTTVLCGVTVAKAQENTDTEFSNWLAGFTYDANLYTVGISYEYDPVSAKPAIGEAPINPIIFGDIVKVTVTWTLTNNETGCKNSCWSTFTIDNACKIDCSSDKTDVLCEGTETGTITISAEGGTIPYTVHLYKEGSVSPDYTKTGIMTSPFSVTFEDLAAGNYTYEVIDANYDTTKEVCNQELPIVVGSGTPCGAHCTYTQGYYGNEGGTSCADGVSYTTYNLINKALMSYPVGTDPETYKMTIGLPGKSISMSNSAADIAKIIQVLPGGGSSVALLAGDFPITGMPASYLKKGNINNTLLAQTITLGLNLGIDGTLGDFVLQAGTLATAAPQGGCGSEIPMPRSCSYDVYTPTINEYEYYTIPAVVNLLPNKTVQGLFDMANFALGGGTLPAGVTLSELAKAVDVINNAFDECRISMGYDQKPLTCIEDRAAFIVNPVPIVDYATVTYKFSYVSPVTIEVRSSVNGALLASYQDPTPSFYDKQFAIPYNFTTSGTYFIRIITNIGSSTKQVIKN